MEETTFTVNPGIPAVCLVWGDGSATMFMDSADAAGFHPGHVTALQRRIMALRLRHLAGLLEEN